MILAVIQQVTLAQAIAIAAAQSPVLAAARDDYRLAQVNVDLARTGSQPNVAVTGNEFSPTSSALSANVRELIFDGGRVLAQIRSAQSAQVAASGTYQRAAQQLAFNVGQSYYNALEAHAGVTLANQIVQQDRQQEDLIRAQIQAGRASQVDLATAHLPTERALLQLAQAQAQDANAESAFLNTIGSKADAAIVPSQSDADTSALRGQPLPYDAALQRALLLRPDYASAHATVAAAEQSVRAARLGLAPQLSAVTSGGIASPTFASTGSVGVQLQFPVFDQGITRAQTSQARVQLDRAQVLERGAELNIERDVSQALATLTGARQALTQADSELTQARGVLANTQEQYRAGVTQLLLVLNAQSNLTLAENDRLNALYALRQAELGYEFALGEIQ